MCEAENTRFLFNRSAEYQIVVLAWWWCGARAVRGGTAKIEMIFGMLEYDLPSMAGLFFSMYVQSCAYTPSPSVTSSDNGRAANQTGKNCGLL